MSTSSGRPLHWSWLGRRAYGPTYALQEEVRRRIRDGRGPERLLLLEHDPVFTLGRNAKASDVLADEAWLASRRVEVFESNRGGQVTFHGPGQLVGYPIVYLGPDRRDIGRYVRDLQEAIIRTLAEIGIAAHRREGKENIGVWVDDRGTPAKIASIGVHLSRWTTIHGFALNVDTDMDYFGGIIACGLDNVRMISVECVLGKAPDLDQIATLFAGHFAEILDRNLVLDAASELVEIEASANAQAGE